MKALVLTICLTIPVYGAAIASESRHSVIVDMPEVATLNHASPDTWHTLPPIHRSDHPTSIASEGARVFGEVSRVATCVTSD